MRNYKRVNRDLILAGIDEYLKTGNMKRSADSVGINRLTLRHNIERIKLVRNMNFSIPVQVKYRDKLSRF